MARMAWIVLLGLLLIKLSGCTVMKDTRSIVRLAEPVAITLQLERNVLRYPAGVAYLARVHNVGANSFRMLRSPDLWPKEVHPEYRDGYMLVWDQRGNVIPFMAYISWAESPIKTTKDYINLDPMEFYDISGYLDLSLWGSEISSGEYMVTLCMESSSTIPDVWSGHVCSNVVPLRVIRDDR